MNCAVHPSVETRVTCSNCGVPICPDCMVFTPVGAKCRDCGSMPKSAMVRVKPERMLLTVVIGLVSALAGGFAFAVLISMISFFAIIVSFGLGYGIGEAISWASGRHHSRNLAIWAVVCAVLAVQFPFLLGGVIDVANHGTQMIGTSALNLIMGGGIWKFLWMAAAGYGAWQRNA